MEKQLENPNQRSLSSQPPPQKKKQPTPYFTFWLQILHRERQRETQRENLGLQSKPQKSYCLDRAEQELPSQALGRGESPASCREPSSSPCFFPPPPAEKRLCGVRRRPGTAPGSSSSGSGAHMASSAPLERSPCSSKRRRTLLLSASARRYGWFRRSAGRAGCQHGHTDTRTHRQGGGQPRWKPIKAACGRRAGMSPRGERMGVPPD